jgi:hypothetical protein
MPLLIILFGGIAETGNSPLCFLNWYTDNKRENSPVIPTINPRISHTRAILWFEKITLSENSDNQYINPGITNQNKMKYPAIINLFLIRQLFFPEMIIDVFLN